MQEAGCVLNWAGSRGWFKHSVGVYAVEAAAGVICGAGVLLCANWA
jgi:hypothetical protein